MVSTSVWKILGKVKTDSAGVCPNDADTIQLKSPTPEYNVVYFQRGKQSRIFGEISLLPDAEDAHKC